jgi:cysteine synthase A
MAKKTILETIGRIPLVKINSDPNSATILAKLEFLNPSGSIKDRIADYMVRMAEKKGELKPGMTIIEATTGNTGISFALVAAVKGYKMIAIMPENMSRERKQIIKAFGAKIVLTPSADGIAGAIKRRDEMAKRLTGSVWVPDQFANEDNVIAHQKTFGKEILEQTGGKVDAFVAGVGTGGSLMGVARAFQKRKIRIKIVAVEPSESAVLSGGKPHNHRICGVGEGFIPKLVDKKVINRIIKVSSREAENMARKLAREEGILAGVSSGANLSASLRIAKELGAGKTIVTVFPDRGERYLSQKLFVS